MQGLGCPCPLSHKRRLLRQLVVHAFDVEVQAEQRAIVGALAGLQPLAAVLLLQRPVKGFSSPDLILASVSSASFFTSSGMLV